MKEELEMRGHHRFRDMKCNNYEELKLTGKWILSQWL